MATSAKTTKSTPSTTSNRVRRLVPGRGATTPSRRSDSPGSQSLVRRVQAILPGAKRTARPRPEQSLAAALERASGAPTTRGPLTKDGLVIPVGGVGAVTAAKRRRNIGPNELPAPSSEQATNRGAGHTRQSHDTIADSSARTGGDHGDSQGPNPATAA
jgi:hypothetical protein